MPFITQDRRERLLRGDADIKLEYGDRCYIHYKSMVNRWNKEPRWRTAHEIYFDMRLNYPDYSSIDDSIAHELAWQVFFQLHILPYELKKREENGDI